MQALSLVKKNQDPLAKCLGARLAISPSLLIGLLDDFVGSLYPTSKRIARYIQRDLDGLGLISGTVEDYVRVFNRCGLQPVSMVQRTVNIYLGCCCISLLLLLLFLLLPGSLGFILSGIPLVP